MGALNETPQDRPDACGKRLLIVLIPLKNVRCFRKIAKSDY